MSSTHSAVSNGNKYPEPTNTNGMDTDSDFDSDYEDIDVDRLPPQVVGPGEHKLQSNYCLWYQRKGVKNRYNYMNSLQLLGRCASVEQWWSLYSHLVRPTSLKPYHDFCLFKSGIMPIWEDRMNVRGGHWRIRLSKSRSNRTWENVCMAMLGEQFMVGSELCGVVLKSKYNDDFLEVWSKTATDQASTTRIRDTLRRILNLPPTSPMVYVIHSAILDRM